MTLQLGPLQAKSAGVEVLFEQETRTVPVRNGAVKLNKLPHFAAFTLAGVLPQRSGGVRVRESAVL